MEGWGEPSIVYVTLVYSRAARKSATNKKVKKKQQQLRFVGELWAHLTFDFFMVCFESDGE